MKFPQHIVPLCFMALLLWTTGCHHKKSTAETVPAENVPAAAEYSYTVSAFKSNVAWSPDDAQWQPVLQGLRMQKGVFVETGIASCATLTGTLGDVVMMGERVKVRLLVEDLEKSGDATLAARGIALFKGAAQFVVAKNRGGFVVETPTASIKVKGTEFTVSYNETSGATDVAVREGNVDILDKKKPGSGFALAAGQALAGVGTPSPKQRVMTAKDSAAFMEGTHLQETTEPENPPARSSTDARETKSRLEKAMTATRASQPVDNGRVAGETVLRNERVAAQAKIDSVRTEYTAAVSREKDTFAAAKTQAVQTVDSARSGAQSALDREREKFKEATGNAQGASHQSSDDAFDELQKRKAGK